MCVCVCSSWTLLEKLVVQGVKGAWNSDFACTEEIRSACRAAASCPCALVPSRTMCVCVAHRLQDAFSFQYCALSSYTPEIQIFGSRSSQRIPKAEGSTGWSCNAIIERVLFVSVTCIRGIVHTSPSLPSDAGICLGCHTWIHTMHAAQMTLNQPLCPQKMVPFHKAV